MAWTPIPTNPNWQYDNNPPDPGGKQTVLWAKQTGGIRNFRGHEVYTRVRRITDTTDITRGELSKTFWDNV